MKISVIKTALLSLFIVAGLSSVQAQNDGFEGKTIIIENTKTDITKSTDGTTRTVSFYLGDFDSQAGLDNLVNSMKSYPGIMDFTVSGLAEDGRRSGQIVLDNTLDHKGVIKYLDAAGIEKIWINDEKLPIEEYYAKRAAAQRQK